MILKTRHINIKKRQIIISVLLIILAGTLCFPNAETAVSAEKPDFNVIIGEWIRPDGGYVIRVWAVKPDGSVVAGYFNPNEINYKEIIDSSVILHIIVW